MQQRRERLDRLRRPPRPAASARPRAASRAGRRSRRASRDAAAPASASGVIASGCASKTTQLVPALQQTADHAATHPPETDHAELHLCSPHIILRPMADLDQLCINTLRMLSVDTVQKAESGHPGMPMGAAAIAYVLWTRFLIHNPADPAWPDRDRFVLSAGHASALLYSLLHLTRVRPDARRPEAVPAVGQPDAGPSRARLRAGRRGQHRPARPGAGQRGRHGDRGAVARGDVQPARARGRRSRASTCWRATAT